MLKKVILIITDNTKEQINGVVTTYKNLEKWAHDDGYSVVYIDPGFYPSFACPGYPEVRLSWGWGISKKIKEIDPQYIHIATEGPLGVAAKLFCDRHNIPYTTAYHTKFPEFLNEIYRIPKSWTRLYLRWFHSRSRMVLATTDTMVKSLTDLGIGCKVKSWTRGVDRVQLKPKLEQIRTNSGPLLLYVGRVSKEKNLDDLCCLENDFNIEIVGDGPYLETLRKKYQKVKFLGYKQGSDLADYYVRADVFVFPSKLDTFGIVMIEAMSLGTPVAAYPVPGPMDVVVSGETGYLDHDLRRAIKQCLLLDRSRIRLKSQKWTWENCWKIFLDSLVDAKI